MLIALLIGYLFLAGGSGGGLWYLGGLTPHQLQKELEKVVSDKDTRKPIAETVKRQLCKPQLVIKRNSGNTRREGRRPALSQGPIATDRLRPEASPKGPLAGVTHGHNR